METHSPDFEKQVAQIAAIGVWQMVTGRKMRSRFHVCEDHRWSNRNGLFVTLRSEDKVRGSMGVLESDTDLQELLFETGGTAATHDARYSPVKEDELSKLEIEVSLLSEVKKLNQIEDIQNKEVGLIVSRADKRAVLLPHVALDFNWSAEQFLEACCEKATLSHKAWKDPNTLVEYFTSLSINGGPLLKLIADFI
jgi:AmmeMemoRadiSam system protein A